MSSPGVSMRAPGGPCGRACHAPRETRRPIERRFQMTLKPIGNVAHPAGYDPACIAAALHRACRMHKSVDYAPRPRVVFCLPVSVPSNGRRRRGEENRALLIPPPDIYRATQPVGETIHQSPAYAPGVPGCAQSLLYSKVLHCVGQIPEILCYRLQIPVFHLMQNPVKYPSHSIKLLLPHRRARVRVGVHRLHSAALGHGADDIARVYLKLV